MLKIIRSHAKLQWLQHPSKINWNNVSNIRRETRKNFRNKNSEYLNDKIDEECSLLGSYVIGSCKN
jgi:hypothetical protein